MSDHFDKQLERMVKQSGESIPALSHDERTRMRTLLADYAAFKPARAAAASSAYRTLHLLARPVFAGALAFTLIITLSGGAAYAAEGALPGDLLYPVKVDVTEPVVSAITPSGKAQATWQLAIVRRRLKEAAVLSAEGRLASSTQAMLAARAANAALKSALNAAALTETATSTTSTASTTETLIKASSLLLEGRGHLREHQDEDATRAFRASIRTAGQVEGLRTVGSFEVEDEHEDDTSTEPEDVESISAPAREPEHDDEGASVYRGVESIRAGEREDVERSRDAEDTEREREDHRD